MKVNAFLIQSCFTIIAYAENSHCTAKQKHVVQMPKKAKHIFSRYSMKEKVV